MRLKGQRSSYITPQSSHGHDHTTYRSPGIIHSVARTAAFCCMRRNFPADRHTCYVMEYRPRGGNRPRGGSANSRAPPALC